MLQTAELKELTLSITQLTSDVGKYILQQREQLSSKNIEKKGFNDFVTYVDKSAEEKLVSGLQTLLPDASFIAEEQTLEQKTTTYTWVVDPLDGTTNFIHGLTPFAISIGLMYDGEIILGIVHELSLDECFYAWKDGGTWLNGNPVHCSSAASLDDSLIATGFPYNDYTRLRNFTGSLTYFMQHTHGLRRLGSAATDLAYVACGRFEAFYEYSLKPWDVAAGSLLVQEAGGSVADFSGKNNYLFGQEIVAAGNSVFKEFSSIIKKFMQA